LIVVNGVINGQIQLLEKSVQGDPNVIGIVITVADEGKNTRTFVIGWDGTSLFPRIKENPPPTLTLQLSLGDIFLKWQISLKHHQARAMP